MAQSSAPTDTIVTLELGDFDRHGTARARYAGRWVEVEHGIPGETVRAEIIGQKRPRGRIVEVLDPAPDRVTAPCPYFRDWACGGCQWQMMSYDGQLSRKRDAIDRVMREAALNLSVTAVHALPDPWRYRSTAGIALGKSAGFRRHASLAIVPLRDCPISHPLIGRLTSYLNDRLDAGDLPDYRGRVRVDVRVVEGERLQTCLRPSEEGNALGDIEPLLGVLAGWNDVGSVSVQRPDGAIETIRGELFAPAQVAGRPVWLSAASFFQTNLLLLPQLIARLQEESAPAAGKRIADVYGGVGIFGLFLTEGAVEVVDIDADPLSIKAGKCTAEEWGVTNMRFVPAPAEEALAGEGSFDIVIVDPPRSGLTPTVIDTLCQTPPSLLLYISCLPQSLARDLTPLMEAGYGVEHLELFDFYPQTYHTEVLAVLRLSGSPAST